MSRKGYRIGDVVEVVDNRSEHRFEIGTTGKVESTYLIGEPREHYLVRDADGARWFCKKQDLVRRRKKQDA